MKEYIKISYDHKNDQWHVFLNKLLITIFKTKDEALAYLQCAIDMSHEIII